MNAPLPDPNQAWHHANDRHVAAIVAGWQLRLAAHLAPEEATRLASDIAVQASARGAAERILAEAGRVPAFTAVVERCGLDDFEAEVMGLCLASELDADCVAMLRRAAPAGGFPTPGLAAVICEAAAPSRMLAFAPTAPLVGLQLLDVEAQVPLAVAALRLAPRVRDFLLGLDRLDTAANFLRPVPAIGLPPSLTELAAEVAAQFGAGARMIALVGPASAGGAAIGAAAIRAAGLTPLRFDGTTMPHDVDAAIRLAAREAALSRLGFLTEHRGADDPLLHRPPAPMVVLARDAVALPVGTPVVTLAAPGLAGRAAVWRAAAPGLSALAARRLARQFDLPPEAIARAAAAGNSTIWSRARQAAAPALAELGERILPRANWKDLVLPDEPLAALREIVAAAETREKVEDRWGLASNSARGQGLAVLLSGPSGTGKTLAAEVLAGALGLEVFRIDLAGLVSKWIGETEKNLARIFDAAAAGGAVLFFDEADALFGKRSEVKDSHDRYANVEVAYLLQRMEQHRGISILATNLRGNLDQAFLRRLRFAVDFPYPDEAARRAIWALHLPKRAPRGADLDLDALARLDLPGGAIRNVVLNGAALAAAAGTAIGMVHLLAAARREFAKLGRLAGGVR